MTSYEKIQQARNPKRLTAKQLISLLTKNFIEFHGDRAYGDDKAIIGGIGRIKGQYVTIIGQEKGSDIDDKMERNFGMAHPEGFRKAIRLAKQAEKFNRPIITIIDTSGAYPGIGAEERGQGSVIANSLYEFSGLNVPVIGILLSEGGSGGALALGVCDHLLMFENGYYSVISPEGYVSILHKGKKQVEDVIDNMKILGDNLIDLDIVEELISEPQQGLTKENYQYQVEDLRLRISEIIKEKQSLTTEALLESRYEKYRKIGR